jgi:hypothetical protein
MRAVMTFRIFVMLSFLLLAPVILQAQPDKKAIELKKLETGLATAKAKVALNERQIAKADSMITAGNKMAAESKTEIKTITAERKKLDKENATRQKSLTKLSTSKNKEEATKAKADLKALATQYKLDAKANDTRLKDATKKSTTGDANITKGKAGKKTAQDALKVSRAALDAAQKKYDVASGSGVEANPKDKKKK